MAANIFESTHRTVRADPDLHLYCSMKIHLRRYSRVFGILTVQNFPVWLIGGQRACGKQERAKRNLFESHKRTQNVSRNAN